MLGQPIDLGSDATLTAEVRAVLAEKWISLFLGFVKEDPAIQVTAEVRPPWVLARYFTVLSNWGGVTPGGGESLVCDPDHPLPEGPRFPMLTRPKNWTPGGGPDNTNYTGGYLLNSFHPNKVFNTKVFLPRPIRYPLVFSPQPGNRLAFVGTRGYTALNYLQSRPFEFDSFVLELL